MAEQELIGLASVFQQSLSPVRDQQKAAEAQLKTLTQQPNFSITVLRLVAANVDLPIRQAASVNFKNLIRYRWVPSEADLYGGVHALPDSEKEQIKALLPGLMLNTPALVQAQLSEALSLICGHDFPQRWPGLLPELVGRLGTDDVATIRGVLQTANSIFKRYRGQPSSNTAVVNELVACQQAWVPAFKAAFEKVAAQVPAATQAGNAELLRHLLHCVRLSFRIFFSLNSMGLTPMFDAETGDLKFWMDQLHAFLAYECGTLVDESDPEKECALDGVKAAACQAINLFMESMEEDFEPFLKMFAMDVWSVLLKVTPRPGQDNLSMAAMRFLTTVARSVAFRLFAENNALQQICESILLPNLRVRPEDEELFEMNPIDYIRRDMEGGDADTRRRASAELLRALAEKFPVEVNGLFAGYIQSALAEYARDPSPSGNGWRAKDCAVYMVLALCAKGRTLERGATSAPTHQAVNLVEFFSAQVLPELASPKVDDVPMLKADALKFLTTFRSLLPKEACLAAFPALVQLLGAQACVVHSYAATAVERLLALKDGGRPRFSVQDLGQHLLPLLERLFAGFRLPDSAENEYLMRAVMRLIGFVGPQISPYSGVCLQALQSMLLEVCKNPRNPGFNHYLFEAVAGLVRHGVAGNPSSIGSFEEMLFPAFQHVLSQDVQEFHPYVFQIFAQLIELRPDTAPLPPVYLSIFPGFVSPVLWERSGNVPALVRLLQAYLSKAGSEVVAGGQLVAVLGVFQKLISSKAHDHEGFEVLTALVDHVPLAAYQEHLPTCFGLMFTRLQGSRTVKFTRCFIVFLCTFVVKHGPQVAQAQLDRVQPGIFFMLLQQVWLPSLASLDLADTDQRLLVVACTRLLCDLPALQAQQPLWSALKDAVQKRVDAASGQAGGLGGEDEEDGLGEEMQGYSAAYARLANAQRQERPVLAEITDPRQYLTTQLQALAQRGGPQ